ncbi:flavin-dependent dehydrogenase [Dysgonomonas alginatilytica]|uniref:Flavin-dependent dehydrogenase n=1 Tax=Dysgonomonas alginatilytica TaxID=1605892 RepID=A0A2V3PRE0_9BACT|nr:NAD(P)/FAD-dependent oxidoreductase [Dysgonomonas alginatilytica]PXV65091.1 flavin-dependent dehydrogenase [Dysgonomonas alginatilytica]
MEIKHFNTIIIGGGPAGITCGYILTKNSKECLIIDRAEFPREKLCGGGLTPKAHKIVKSIFGEITYDYHAVNNFEVYSDNKYLCTYRLYTETRTVSRKEFDYVLYKEYINIGGKIQQGKPTVIEEKEGKVYITLADGQLFSCDYLVGADGANSFVRNYLHPNRSKGIICLETATDDKSIENIQVFFPKEFVGGFAYIFPNKDGCVVGCGYENLDVNVFRKYLKDNNIVSNQRIRGAYIPMFDKIDYPFKDNIILIGDAGGYADSISGEGLYYAFKTGENAAISIINNSSFEIQNRDVIKKILKTTKCSNLFYNKLVNSLFLFLFKKGFQHRRIEKLLNRYLGF